MCQVLLSPHGYFNTDCIHQLCSQGDCGWLAYNFNNQHQLHQGDSLHDYCVGAQRGVVRTFVCLSWLPKQLFSQNKLPPTLSTTTDINKPTMWGYYRKTDRMMFNHIIMSKLKAAICFSCVCEQTSGTHTEGSGRTNSHTISYCFLPPA